MNVEMTTRIIQLILAPVVMITSCSLVLSGLLGRYAAVNDRMRAMARERLDLLHSPSATTEKYATERLQEIDMQIPDLLNRHRLLHHSVLVVYIAILLFVVSMFVIALAAVWDSVWLSAAVLIVFVGGTTALFIGVLIAIVEVRSSHRAVEYEIRRVSELSK
jgi:hypothetical protein